VLLSSQQAYRERYGKADISGHEAIVSAMAVGLVIAGRPHRRGDLAHAAAIRRP
jgi:hypothetical protein